MGRHRLTLVGTDGPAVVKLSCYAVEHYSIVVLICVLSALLGSRQLGASLYARRLARAVFVIVHREVGLYET